MDGTVIRMDKTAVEIGFWGTVVEIWKYYRDSRQGFQASVMACPLKDRSQHLLPPRSRN
jgi:hypothetical protein